MLFSTKPNNEHEAAALARAKQLTDFKWTPVRDIYTYIRRIGQTVFPAGAELTGFIYSSTERTDKFITENVSIETYLSAIANPHSKLYSAPTGALGAPCYGIVCNGFIRYAFGIKERVSTNHWFIIPGMRAAAEAGCYSMEDIRLLDVLHVYNDKRNHVALITDILKDASGVIREIEVSEACRPLCKRVSYTVEEFYKKYEVFRLCRYDKLDQIPLLDEQIDELLWNSGIEKRLPLISVDNGNRSNYLVGERVVVSVFSEEPDTVELMRNNEPIATYATAGRACFTLEPDRGYYTARLKNAQAEVEFAVNGARIDHACDADLITVRADACDADSEISYMDFRGASTRYPDKRVGSLIRYERLTADEQKSGLFTRSIPDGAEAFKVYFKNKYGVWTHEMTRILRHFSDN